MKKPVRLILGIMLGLAVYYLSSEMIPSIGFIDGFVRRNNWLTGNDITQASFLIISLLLISLFSRGKVATYGLRPVKVSAMKKPVLLSIIVSFVIISISMVLSMKSMQSGVSSESMMAPRGILKPILSVWVMASISEEVFFRGLLQGFLSPLKQYGFTFIKIHVSVPVTICAVWFGLGHFGLLRVMNVDVVIGIVISAMALGFIAGYYFEKTGSIIPAIAVHMVFNIVGTFTTVIFMKVLAG